MDPEWQKTFHERMSRFDSRRSLQENEVAVSIKIRVAAGCFHREHSPNAYRMIDRNLRNLPSPPNGLQFEEHESGPELLIYLAVTTAGITLAKSVIDLITTIIKARADGIRAGDRSSAPLELIVRRVDRAGEYREEVVLRIGHTAPVGNEDIEERLNEALKRLVGKTGVEHGQRET